MGGQEQFDKETTWRRIDEAGASANSTNIVAIEPNAAAATPDVEDDDYGAAAGSWSGGPDWRGELEIGTSVPDTRRIPLLAYIGIFVRSLHLCSRACTSFSFSLPALCALASCLIGRPRLAARCLRLPCCSQAKRRRGACRTRVAHVLALLVSAAPHTLRSGAELSRRAVLGFGATAAGGAAHVEGGDRPQPTAQGAVCHGAACKEQRAGALSARAAAEEGVPLPRRQRAPLLCRTP